MTYPSAACASSSPFSSRRPTSIACLERHPGLGAVARAPLRVAEAQQKLAAPFAGCFPDQREQLERPPVVDRRLLVREERARVVAGANDVLEGFARIAERGGHIEMASDLREMRIEVVAVHRLEQPAHVLVELEPASRRKIVVQRLADELVRERVPARRGGQLGDDADRGGLLEDVEQAPGAQSARVLEEMKIEFAADDGGDPEGVHRLAREAGHAPANQDSDLLRDAEEGVARRLLESLERLVGGKQPDDLLDEEGVARRDLVEPCGDLARRLRPGDGLHVALDVR